MINEYDFLKNLYNDFTYSTGRENQATRREVGEFISNSALWAKEGSSYKIRLELQRKIKYLTLEIKTNKAIIDIWVEAFEEIENYIKEKKKNKRNTEPAEYNVRIIEHSTPNVEIASEEIGYVNDYTPIWTNYSIYYSTTTTTTTASSAYGSYAYSASPIWYYSTSDVNISTTTGT